MGERALGPALDRRRGIPALGPQLPTMGPDGHREGHAHPGSNQRFLEALGIRPKLEVSQASDPEEQEADRAADAFVAAAPRPAGSEGSAKPSHVIQRKCVSCGDDEAGTARITRKANGGHAHGGARLPAASAAGSPIPAATRRPYEVFFRADFSRVVLHDHPVAHRAAAELNAHAFSHGSSIFFARGRFEPHATEGRRLLAHELAHTMQRPPRGVRRQGLEGPLPADSEANMAAGRIVQAVRSDDISGAVTPLRQRSVVELTAMRATVKAQAEGVLLEHWLVARMNRSSTRRIALGLLGAAALPGASRTTTPLAALGGVSDRAADGTAEEGVRLLWPALSLIEKLLLYDEAFREIEQAQLDVIRAASQEQRNDAKKKEHLADLERILRAMDAKEEYDARILFDPSPAGLWAAAARVLIRGNRDPLYDAILALAPNERREFVRMHEVDLFRMLSLSELVLVCSMARQVTVGAGSFGGNEVDALIARLRLATEGRLDDMAAVQAVVDRAVALLKERQQLRASRLSPMLPEKERNRIDNRLAELNSLDRLFEVRPGAGGAPAGLRLMRLLSAARDNPDSFLADAQRFGEFAPTPQAAREHAFEVAKQRILLVGSDLEGIRNVLYSTQAPPVLPAAGAAPSATAAAQQASNEQLRRDILRNVEVASLVSGLKGSERRQVELAVGGDAFDALLSQVSQANDVANWGQLFTLILRIARNEAWRARYDARRKEFWGVHARIRGEQRTIVEAILRDPRRLPLASLLAFTGNVNTLRTVLDEMPEQQRSRLRLGWALSRGLVSGEQTDDQKNALGEYRGFLLQVRGSQTTAGLFDEGGFEAILGAALGSAPTAEELTVARGEGLYRAAALMYERQEARERLGRGVSAHFTETDETMSAAAREFGALWLQLRDRSPRQLTMVEFATLSALHQRFLSRAEEFADASNTISEMAGMIAATVAGIVVVVATGGAATPAVIAIAAASGAGARVVTREMFGEDYYNSLSDQSARDALLGAVDAALAVVSARFAARGAELVGLGGRVLTGSASRIAGAVAEEATQPFARRVAASAVESALDGLLSGAVSEAFGAMTDDRTWRRGITNGLVRVGQAALVAGLTGLAAGGVIGAAAPVLRAGARRLWEGVVGQSLENTLARAGAGDALAKARYAARNGDVVEANRLAAQLEPHLTPEQVLALREELDAHLRLRLGRPPGTAQASSPAQERLLRESGGAAEGRLTPEHMDAEWDIVRRSDPQPSRTQGYVDEVDLGNGHSWKRQANGAWCRFTKPSQCAIIPNAPTMSASARARAEASYEQLLGLRGDLAAARQVVEEYPAIADKLVRAHRRGQRGLRLDTLSRGEKEILGDVFPDRDLEDLALRDIQRARGRPGAEYGRLVAAEEAAMARLRESTRPLYDKVRAASPTASLRDRTISTARGLDGVSGLAPRSGTLQADHIVPIREIVDMPGFSKLNWEDQVAIANYERNLMAVDGRVNASRQDRSWAEPFPARGTYTFDALQKIRQREAALRQELQAEINRRLAASGRATL